ncbi:adenosylcobinamide kinase /adenosylcobinamide-phosphate guanylyltransferase [Clostridium cavendishii DSM 21758]|uniref:Bifunctional adenosylcobalamin biosynthesis protein CobU n=1 Tax=Clostridium cavendishii DSM 21758 TaxID=1121302 RepID=A0A1M6T9B0_9CLOT|nr:bifunctional adenosylcobinamide kinase/adenosylcobinamide-phosphate guanylyltransferase [Clostridium cavendishii]SHK53464.1 adenosylcobinamide kinase /adenosylcobinamide-phosphate guanylyltransferase [Clostridium cavendishii DSM 21758]
MILVTGGARSGKSSFGESLLKDKDNVLYIATSIPFDDEMKSRVKKHQEDRPSSWDTLEEYKDLGAKISKRDKKYDGIILECITIMISNLMLENFDEEREIDYVTLEKDIMKEMKSLVEELKKVNSKVVLITNEVGAGIVPENRLAREFRDIAGRVNQYLARESEEVYLVVSGIGVKIK